MDLEKEDMEDVQVEDEVRDKKGIYIKIIYIPFWFRLYCIYKNIIIYSICDFSRIKKILKGSWKWLTINNNILLLLYNIY